MSKVLDSKLPRQVYLQNISSLSSVHVIPHFAVGLMLHREVEKGRIPTKDLVKSCVYLLRLCNTNSVQALRLSPHRLT